MTEEEVDALTLKAYAVWQWIGVALAHAVFSTRPPYLEPMLIGMKVLFHSNDKLTITFADETIIQVAVTTIPDMHDLDKGVELTIIIGMSLE